MASSVSNAAGSLDGPNKKCRVQEMIQLPDSLDDAMLQPPLVAPQQLPADEARRQLDTLQLGSADDPPSPRSAAVSAAEGTVGEAAAAVPGPNTQRKDKTPANGSGLGRTRLWAATPCDEPTQTLPYLKDTSVEPATSDPGLCISLDVAAGTSALEGLGRDDVEGEVTSHRAALTGAIGGGPGGARGGAGFEIFVGGLPPDAREDLVRTALSQLGDGEVLSVRLQLTRGTSICKGYGFATFANESAAQRALSEAAAGRAVICSRRVGLHPARQPFRAVLAAAQGAAGHTPLQQDPDASASINALLGALRAHPDKKAAVAAALQVIQRGAKRAYASTVAATTMQPASHADGATAVQPSSAQRSGNAGKRQAIAPAAVGTASPGEAPAGAAKCAAASEAGADVGGGSTAAAVDSAAAAKQAAKASTDGVAGAGGAATAIAEAGAEAGATGAAGAAGLAAAAAGKPDKPAAPAATAGGSAAAGGAGAGGAGATAAAAADKKGAATAGQASGMGQGPAKDKEKEKTGPGPSQDLMAALAAYPKISKLLESLKGSNRVPKTALMVLHEYATKMSYEVSYLETSEGPAGPYTVEARLMTSGSQSTNVATASGKARTKKDAKQVAAAACLEKLMEGPKGLTPQDLLPAPKVAGAVAARGGKAGAERGAAYNSAGPYSGGKKQPPPGRDGGRPPPGGHPPPHREPPLHARDMPPYREPQYPIYRGGPPPPVLLPPPPPPPPGHGPLMSGRGHPGPSYSAGGGGASMGSGSRGPLSGGNGSAGGGNGGGGGYSHVQQGLMPAHVQAVGAVGRSGAGGGGGHSPGSFGGPSPATDLRGPAARGQRGGGGGADPYGGGSFGSGGGGGSGAAGGYGVAGPASGLAGATPGPTAGGSMVQLGLARQGNGGASTSGGQYGGLYGRDGGPGVESYSGTASYDMAAGQKRTYSTAMQAAYGTPASTQGLLPVRPPQHPAVGAGGAVLGGPASASADPFAAQAGGRGFLTSQQQQQPVLSQAQPVASQGLFGQVQVAATGQTAFAQQQQQQVVFAQPTATATTLQTTFFQGSQYGGVQTQAQQQQQPQQSMLGVSSAGAGGGSGGVSLYGMSQTVQLQPAQPQPLFAAGSAQPAVAAAPSLYGVGATQQQSAQVYGNVVQQPQQGGLFGTSTTQQQASFASLYGMGQQAAQLHIDQPTQQQQQYGMGSAAAGVPGLQGFGAARPGGGLWG